MSNLIKIHVILLLSIMFSSYDLLLISGYDIPKFLLQALILICLFIIANGSDEEVKVEDVKIDKYSIMWVIDFLIYVFLFWIIIVSLELLLLPFLYWSLSTWFKFLFIFGTLFYIGSKVEKPLRKALGNAVRESKK